MNVFLFVDAFQNFPSNEFYFEYGINFVSFWSLHETSFKKQIYSLERRIYKYILHEKLHFIVVKLWLSKILQNIGLITAQRFPERDVSFETPCILYASCLCSSNTTLIQNIDPFSVNRILTVNFRGYTKHSVDAYLRSCVYGKIDKQRY